MLRSDVPRPRLPTGALVPLVPPGAGRHRATADKGTTDLSKCCTIRPFLDQDIQFGPGMKLSARFKTLITRGESLVGGLATLQTLRSPSEVWVASMSDFCFEDDACQARLAMGEGPRDVLKVWRMVKEGCRQASKMEPFL